MEYSLYGEEAMRPQQQQTLPCKPYQNADLQSITGVGGGGGGGHGNPSSPFSQPHAPCSCWSCSNYTNSEVEVDLRSHRHPHHMSFTGHAASRLSETPACMPLPYCKQPPRDSSYLNYGLTPHHYHHHHHRHRQSFSGDLTYTPPTFSQLSPSAGSVSKGAGQWSSRALSNKVALYNWYLLRPNAGCSCSNVSIGGFLCPKALDTEKIETAPIVERLEECTLVAKDGVVVMLVGLIDECTTVSNGFSLQIAQLFLSGFPHIWSLLLGMALPPRGTSRSTCLRSCEFCGGEAAFRISLERDRNQGIIAPDSQALGGKEVLEGPFNAAALAEHDEVENLVATTLSYENPEFQAIDHLGEQDPLANMMHEQMSNHGSPARIILETSTAGSEERENKPASSSPPKGVRYQVPLPASNEHLVESATECKENKELVVSLHPETDLTGTDPGQTTQGNSTLQDDTGYKEAAPLIVDGQYVDNGGDISQGEVLEKKIYLTRLQKKEFCNATNGEGVCAPSCDPPGKIRRNQASSAGVSKHRASKKKVKLARFVRLKKRSPKRLDKCKEPCKRNDGTNEVLQMLPCVVTDDGVSIEACAASEMVVSSRDASLCLNASSCLEVMPIKGLQKREGKGIRKSTVKETKVLARMGLQSDDVTVEIDNHEDPASTHIKGKTKIEDGLKAAGKRRFIMEANSSVRQTDFDFSRKKKAKVIPPPLPSPVMPVSRRLISAAFGLKTSRSGRLLVPPLAHWRGQCLMRDMDGGIIAVDNGADDTIKADTGIFNFTPPIEAKARKLQQWLCAAATEYFSKGIKARKKRKKQDPR